MTTSDAAMIDKELEAIRSRDDLADANSIVKLDRRALLAEVDRLRAQVQRVEALAEHWLYQVPSARYSSREVTAALAGDS